LIFFFIHLISPRVYMNSLSLRKTTLCVLTLGSVLLSSCGDPKREAQLRWREDEVNAKENQLALRENKLAEERRAVDSLQAEVSQKQASLVKREKDLVVLEEAARKAKIFYETKAKRGSVPSTEARRVLVIDPDAPEEPLYEKNADLKGAIASTTKIMTALLICETGDLDKIITIEDSDTKCAPVKIGLKKGETYTRRNLLTALMVKSSNDIAQALARDNAGSVEAFVAKMNARAKELGCANTLFINPNGLPPVNDQPSPYSTAKELAKITIAADKLKDVREMVKLKSYWFDKSDGTRVPLENTNRVLRTYEYCDGFKTGFTEAAGYCLVASGQRDGRRRIVVILNGERDSWAKDAQALLEWALKA
jgi:serine-type D-Ala-D-Ala carboxypeptidase (penicillin-binding protein 5/6)